MADLPFNEILHRTYLIFVRFSEVYNWFFSHLCGKQWFTNHSLINHWSLASEPRTISTPEGKGQSVASYNRHKTAWLFCNASFSTDFTNTYGAHFMTILTTSLSLPCVQAQWLLNPHSDTVSVKQLHSIKARNAQTSFWKSKSVGGRRTHFTGWMCHCFYHHFHIKIL